MAEHTMNYNLIKPDGNENADIADINANMDLIDDALFGKVDKSEGKGLSANDFTDAHESELETAYNHSEKIAGNPHKVTKADVGLGNVDNTSDANKPVSTAVQTALNGKANKSTHVKATLTAAGWNKQTKTYSFESTYPHAQYDIQVAYAKTCTSAQLDAWNGAMIAGDIESNAITALGDVPTVDIPIIVEAVEK